MLCILNIFSMHATSHLRASPSRGLKIVYNIHLCVLRMLLVAASGLYMPVSAGSLTVSAQPTLGQSRQLTPQLQVSQPIISLAYTSWLCLVVPLQVWQVWLRVGHSVKAPNHSPWPLALCFSWLCHCHILWRLLCWQRWFLQGPDPLIDICVVGGRDAFVCGLLLVLIALLPCWLGWLSRICS